MLSVTTERSQSAGKNIYSPDIACIDMLCNRRLHFFSAFLCGVYNFDGLLCLVLYGTN
jgi:hypothetical protein